MPGTTLVVPCYNEAARLDTAAFTTFLASRSDARLIFVNDGSRDATLGVLERIRSSAPGCIDVVNLPKNGGKAEAVRRGVLRALESDAEFIGYWDADLSTPLDASDQFARLLRERPTIDVVMGSRVQLLGRTIVRRAARHYMGRVFATAASTTLGIPVYDTQCGAKLFRSSPRLRHVFEQPFRSAWAFDVEIIARYGALSRGYAPDQLREMIYEVPLDEWRHVGGSTVRPFDLVLALLDLTKIYKAYVRRARSHE